MALPIDEALPRLLASLRQTSNLVLSAPPGAGKTTRVPPAIADAGLAGDRQVVVLEPRRLAARMAARRVAAECGEQVGGRVGFQVRFENACSKATQIRFVTEGVLARQMIDDPQLRSVGVIVADEIHERHLAADVVLARARALQAGTRPDLRIVAMSATLDAGPLVAYLGDSAHVESAGRAYPVDVDYLEHADDRPLEKQVSAAVRRLAADGLDGDVLVFLPGAGEIRRAAEACADVARAADLDVVALHGDLPPAEQDRAVSPGPRRKLILLTNVAESSITIDGVTAVIDSGLARVARHSAWTGLPALRVEPISQASAAQRAGRAGRTQPGRCLRLYTRHDHDGRRAHDDPEILRADLAEVALDLAAAGCTLTDLSWLDAPPEPAVRAATELLDRLGAIDDGALTAIGRRMLRFPVHPRLARVAVAGEDRGVGREACALAALAAEREIRSARRAAGLRGRATADASGPSDLLEDLARLDEVRDGGARAARAAGLEPAAVRAVLRAERQLRRVARDRADAPAGGAAIDEALLECVLAGFPDRVARRRVGRQLVFAGGGGGTLADSSVVLDAELMVCVRAGERGRGRADVIVTSASEVRGDWLIDAYIDRIDDSAGLEWNPVLERVEHVSRIAYDGLVLEEKRDAGRARLDPQAAGEVLAEAVRAAGAAAFVSGEGLAIWRRRVTLAREHASELDIPPVDEAGLVDAIAAAGMGCVSFAELRAMDPESLLRGALTAGQRAAVRPVGADACGVARPAAGAGALRRRSAAVDRVAPAGLLRPGRRPACRGRPSAAGLASVGAQPPRRAGDHRPGRLLGPALSRAAAPADAPLPAPRLARGPGDRGPAASLGCDRGWFMYL